MQCLMLTSWVVSVKSMEGGEQAFLQQMTNLAEAATKAAVAAEQALQAVGSASSGSDPTQSGLSAATRVLKNPDTFNGDDPYSFSTWKFAFTSWLSYGDSRYQAVLEEIERHVGQPMRAYNPAETEMSKKLYAILCSYLKGKCVSLVRSLEKTKDGFRLWQALHQRPR